MMAKSSSDIQIEDRGDSLCIQEFLREKCLPVKSNTDWKNAEDQKLPLFGFELRPRALKALQQLLADWSEFSQHSNIAGHVVGANQYCYCIHTSKI